MISELDRNIELAGDIIEDVVDKMKRGQDVELDESRKRFVIYLCSPGARKSLLDILKVIVNNYIILLKKYAKKNALLSLNRLGFSISRPTLLRRLCPGQPVPIVAKPLSATKIVMPHGNL